MDKQTELDKLIAIGNKMAFALYTLWYTFCMFAIDKLTGFNMPAIVGSVVGVFIGAIAYKAMGGKIGKDDFWAAALGIIIFCILR